MGDDPGQQPLLAGGARPVDREARQVDQLAEPPADAPDQRVLLDDLGDLQPELLQGAGQVAAAAEEAAVQLPLEVDAGGPQRGRGGQRRGDRGDLAGLRAEAQQQRAQAQHEPQVEQEQAAGQQGVDEAALEQHLDLHHAVAGDAVAERQRHGDHRHRADEGERVADAVARQHGEDQEGQDARQRADGQDADAAALQRVAELVVAVQQGDGAGREERAQDQPARVVDPGGVGAEELVHGELQVEDQRQHVEQGLEPGPPRDDDLLVREHQEEVQEQRRQQEARERAGVAGDDVAPEVARPVQVGHEEHGEQQAHPEEQPRGLRLPPAQVDHQADQPVGQGEEPVVRVEAVGGAERAQPHRHAQDLAVAHDQVGHQRADLLPAEQLGGLLGRGDQGGADADDLVARLQQVDPAVGPRRHLQHGDRRAAQQPDRAVVGADLAGVQGGEQAEPERGERPEQMGPMADGAAAGRCGKLEVGLFRRHRYPGPSAG
ncbi:MAG: hypothetical protein IPH09_07155 [bacterium]|nr:hypothetical protein [bacterium]